MKKKCSKCGEVKGVEEFGKDRSSKDGLQSRCKLCKSDTDRDYRINNKERLSLNRKIARKNWSPEEKEEMEKYQKNFYTENKGDIQEYKKEYYLKNKSKINNSSSIHYQENKKSILIQNKKYQQENKDKISERKRNSWYKNHESNKAKSRNWQLNNKPHRREYLKNRRETDVLYNLGRSLRRRTSDYIKSQSAIKSNKTIELLGCTIKEVRDHLESLFTEGMNWNNHSLKGWHIDHIKPVSSFDLTNPEQQKICFHYTNYQPLWAEDNLKKGAKLNWKPNK